MNTNQLFSTLTKQQVVNFIINHPVYNDLHTIEKIQLQKGSFDIKQNKTNKSISFHNPTEEELSILDNIIKGKSEIP